MKRRSIAVVAVLLASIAVSALVYVELALVHPQLGWDEAKHTLQGALIAQDVREGDLSALLFDSYRQVYWPPLHSWLVAAAFFVGGTGIEAARGVSAVSFALLATTLFLVARSLAPRHGTLAGCLAAGLALASPGLIEFAAKGMLEMPGMLALSLTMWVFCVLETHPRARSWGHGLIGLGIVVSYLIKTNYGILLLLAFVLVRLIRARFRLRPLLTRENLFAILPVVLFFVVWFAYPKKLLWTWDALVNVPWGGEEAVGLAGLAFYPRVFVAYAGSWWMATILVIGLAGAWSRRHAPGVLFVALTALLLFVIGEIHHTKHPRHILPMFPPLIALTGVLGAGIWDRLRSAGGLGRGLGVAALSGVAILHGAALATRQWIPSYPRDWDRVLDHVVAAAREHPPALILATRDARPRPPMVDLELVSRGLLPATASTTVMNPTAERRLAASVADAPIPETLRGEMVRLLGRYDARSPARSLHPESRGGFSAGIEVSLEGDPPRTIVAMIGDADSARYGERFLMAAPARVGYRSVSVRVFPGARTRVYVYRLP